MKLTLENLKNREAWERAGISLPAYDVAALAERTKKAPVWVHMGIGNIFRIFMGGIADRLVSGGFMDKGITCVETFDFDLVDKIYRPCDNLTLSVILKNDGTRDCRVLGALTEAVKAQAPDAAVLDAGRTPGAAPGADRPASAADAGQWERTKEIFACSNLVEALKFLSCVLPVFKFFIFVFKIAAPLPGFTCWKSNTCHGSPSTIKVNPVLKSPAEIAIIIAPILSIYCLLHT